MATLNNHSTGTSTPDSTKQTNDVTQVHVFMMGQENNQRLSDFQII